MSTPFLSCPEPVDSPADWVLNENSVWITVGNISVNLKKGDEGVSVTFYPKGREADDSIGETYVLYSEAKDEEE